MSSYVQNCSTLWVWTSNFKPTSPPTLSPQMINNQLKENIIQGWLLHVIRSFLQVGFVFSINSLILSVFPLTSFHLAKVNLVPRAILKNQKPLLRPPLTAKRCAGVRVELKPRYLLFGDFIYLCVQLSKNITKCSLL